MVIRGIAVHVLGQDISTVPFSLSLRRRLTRPSRGSETCRGESERSGTKGAASGGSRHASRGCASLHLATRGRNFKASAPCDDPASKAPYQLLTSIQWTSNTQVSTYIKDIFMVIPALTLGNSGLIYRSRSGRRTYLPGSPCNEVASRFTGTNVTGSLER